MAHTLPPKEQNLFKSVVRFYETKQLKKALKTAEQVLKKFPEHGETLAMKGLIVNQLDRKAEAHELVRRGLMKDMKSHICWHVYGLLYRSHHDYHEAAKAYLNALRLDPNNQQILRDLALLQIQIRDFEGFEESRRKLLTVRPNQRNNWLGVAIAFHLQKNYEQALRVLKTYQNTLDESAANAQDPFERSEILLYELSILEESQDYEGALEHLEKSQKRIVDQPAAQEARARLLLLAGRFRDAETELRQLISINPNNHQYYRDLWEISAKALESADKDQISLQVCDEFAHLYPEARAPMRLGLGIISGAHETEFLKRLDKYVRPFLRRGIPSLFSDLKSLYADPLKVQAIATLFESYLAGMTSESHRLPPPLLSDEKHTDLVFDEPSRDCASVRMWVHHYLAQHFDRIGDFDRACEQIELAMESAEFPVECLMTKARILKHCGNITGAVEIADKARRMDLADRFVNTKSTKYALRADNVPQAEAWISLFTRDGDSGGVQALYDMQCVWYELEAAESHLRCGEIPLALKKFIAVERHFTDFVEDQFDFHTYCLRKVTLRSYLATLRMEDRIRSHPYFARSAGGIVKCLLALDDMDESESCAITGGLTDVKGFSELSVSDRKKALSKMKKKAAKEKGKLASTHQSVVSNAATQNSIHKSQQGNKSIGQANGKAPSNSIAKDSQQSSPSGKTGNASSQSSRASGPSEKAKSNPGWMETDPDGLEFVKSLWDSGNAKLTPISEASGRVKLLEQCLPLDIRTHRLAFEHAMRTSKLLRALRAVRRARAIDLEGPDALVMSIRLIHRVELEKTSKTLPDHVLAVLEQKGIVLEQQTIAQEVEAYIARHDGNISRLLGAGEAMLWMACADVTGSGEASAALNFVAKALARAKRGRDGPMTVSAESCSRILQIMSSREYGQQRSALEPVVDVCRKLYPESTQMEASCRRRSRCIV